MKISALILSLAVLISLIEFRITATSMSKYPYDVLGGETDSSLKTDTFCRVETRDDDDDDDSLDEPCMSDMQGNIEDAEDEIIEETTTETIEANRITERTTTYQEDTDFFSPDQRRPSDENTKTNDNYEDYSHATGDDDDTDDDYLSDQCEIETGFDSYDTEDIPRCNSITNQANELCPEFLPQSLQKQLMHLISPIYCHEELLKTIQLSEVFSDGKTFVDLHQKYNPSVTLANFEKLMVKSNRKPSPDQLRIFINDNFERSKEIIKWTPPDMDKDPPILKKIADKDFRNWLKDLNKIWETLARIMLPEVLENPTRYSFIPVEHGFIVPGGRFEESYYWDSYWTIEGLLLCGMHKTAKGILLNFFSMIQRYGFIPNGGRVYYLMRSQPPLLIAMVEKYIEATNDVELLNANLHLLEKEFDFFEREKTVDVHKNGKIYKMARYFVKSRGPRPESYREDYMTAQYFKTDEEKQTFYDDMKAGAESGWDFSSRWFINNHNDAAGNLTDISTRNIIPVDLNAFLQRNARKLSEFNENLKNTLKANHYKEIAVRYQNAINEVLWNEQAGIWFDYDLKNQKPRKIFFPTNLTPLYTKSFDKRKSSIYASKAVNYLKSQGINGFLGGVPTSFNPSGEQWDAPNAWSPLQSITVQGLYNTQSEPALSAAEKLATRWIRSNYISFKSYGKMFEKYEDNKTGVVGGGGEYPVQEGFAWTNGVVFEFLDMYPNMTVSDKIL